MAREPINFTLDTTPRNGAHEHEGRHTDYSHLSNHELLDHPAAQRLIAVSDVAAEMAKRLAARR